MTSRSLFQRICVVLGLIVLSVYLFYIGKVHTLLIDTNAVTVDDKELRSYASATISIDGEELDFPLGRAERAMVTVRGPKHRIVIVDDSGSAEKIESTLTIPTFTNTAIVSIPAIIGGAPAEHWLLQFTAAPIEDAPVEQMQYQDDDNGQ